MSKEEMRILKIEELLKDENKFNSYVDSHENNDDLPYEEGLENRILIKITKYIEKTKTPPIKPNSSDRILKIKSVLCCGKKR